MTLLAKIFGLKVVEIDNECPFEPSHINGKAILVRIGNKAIVG